MDAHHQLIQINIQDVCLQTLSQYGQIYIKQKMDLIEVLGCCEKQNTYYVWGGKSGDQMDPQQLKHLMPIFKCKEKSNCYQRHCLPYIIMSLCQIRADCHAFQMKIKQFVQHPEHQQFQQQPQQHGKNDEDDKELVMKFDRPYKCTWLCLNRPVMDIYTLNNGAANQIGSIVYPCLCCQVGVIINDISGNMVCRVMGSACQLAFFCHLPCKACQTVYFKIFDANNQEVGELIKESAGCMKACISDADFFRVIYPLNATVEQKALLMASALFIDYNYFETSPADDANKKS